MHSDSKRFIIGLMATSSILYLVGLAAYSGLEYWLGKTDKTKSGSVLEIVERTVAEALKHFLGGNQ